MATFRIPILGPGLRLDDAGNLRFETMQGSVWTGGTIDEFIAVYPDTDTTDYIFGSIKVPVNYSSATTDPGATIRQPKRRHSTGTEGLLNRASFL